MERRLKKEKISSPFHCLQSIHQQHCRQTFAWEAEGARGPSLYSWIANILRSVWISSHTCTHSLTLFRCVVLSPPLIIVDVLFPLLLAPRQLRDTAAMGEEGVCVRMYVCLCSSVFVREWGSMRATEGGVSGDRGEERGKQLVGLNPEEKEKAERGTERSLEEKIQGVLQRMTGMNGE